MPFKFSSVGSATAQVSHVGGTFLGNAATMQGCVSQMTQQSSELNTMIGCFSSVQSATTSSSQISDTNFQTTLSNTVQGLHASGSFSENTATMQGHGSTVTQHSTELNTIFNCFSHAQSSFRAQQNWPFSIATSRRMEMENEYRDMR